MAKCECDICKRHQRIKDIVASRDPDKLIAMVNELADALASTEMDLNYDECILDGSWPSAVYILENALCKAIVHPDRKDSPHDDPIHTLEDRFRTKLFEVWKKDPKLQFGVPYLAMASEAAKIRCDLILPKPKPEEKHD